jgi:hypothetical protein
MPAKRTPSSVLAIGSGFGGRASCTSILPNANGGASRRNNNRGSPWEARPFLIGGSRLARTGVAGAVTDLQVEMTNPQPPIGVLRRAAWAAAPAANPFCQMQTGAFGAE